LFENYYSHLITDIVK